MRNWLILALLLTAVSVMAQTKAPTLCLNDACSLTHKLVVAGQVTVIPNAQHYVRLDWQRPSTGTVDYYNIYAGTANGGPYTLVSTSPMPLQGWPHLNPTSDLNTYVVTSFCVACSPQESDPSNEAQVTMPFLATSITVLPTGVGVPIGATSQFTASASDAFGHTANACVSSGWASANPAIATINATTGLATGVSAGATQISCADSGLTGPATLVVVAAPDFSNPATPCTAPCGLASGTQGVAYANTLTAAGGTAPYTYSVTVGTLPTGLGLTGALISGTPTVLATSTFTIQVCDIVPVCTSLQMSLTILPVVGGDGGPPDYSMASTSLADTTTPLTAIFDTSTAQNSVADDTQLPSHIAGTYKYTRITDAIVLRGATVTNVTPSGGDNNRTFSYPEGKFWAVQTSDAIKIFELSVVNHAFQVVNTGPNPPTIRGHGIEFSWITETRFYHAINTSLGIIYQSDLTNLSSGHIVNGTTGYSDTALFNFFTPGNCPGGQTSFTPGWQSDIGISTDDDSFIVSEGTSAGQGSADRTFKFTRTHGVGGGPGCGVVNWATGQFWAVDTCAPGACTGSEPPTTTFADVPTQCWGSRGSLGWGIHNSQGSGDGNFAAVSRENASSGWTKGGCASTPGPVILNWTTGTNQFCQGDALQCAGHDSIGVSHGLYNYWASGMTTRSLSDVSTFTLFYTIPPIQDEHCAWPHNSSGTYVDTLPWLCAGDAVTVAQGGVYTPKYLNNELFAVNPSLPFTQIAKRFGHTFSCNANLGAHCTDNIQDAFGPGNSIGQARPKGDGFCFGSSMLHALGNNRADGFCIYLGPQ